MLKRGKVRALLMTSRWRFKPNKKQLQFKLDFYDCRLLNIKFHQTTICDTAHSKPTSGVGGGVRGLRAAVTICGVGVDLDGLDLLGNPCSCRNIKGIKRTVSHQTIHRRS